MSGIQQCSELLSQNSLIVTNELRKPSIFNNKNITFNSVDSNDVWSESPKLSLENNSVFTIDEHEQGDSLSSLKRKLNSTKLSSTSDCIKLAKNDNADSCKEAKVFIDTKNVKNKRSIRRRSAKEGIDCPIEENVESSTDDKKVNYALTSEQSTYETDQLVLCKNQTAFALQNQKRKKLKLFLKQTSIVNNSDKKLLQQYQEHFEHAFTCPKLNDGICSLLRCKNPFQIRKFVHDNIKPNMGNAARVSGEQENFNMVVQVLMNHANTCDQPLCSMPLCNEFEKVMSKVISPSTENDLYETVFTNRTYSKSDHGGVYLKKGIDFDLLLDLHLAKGAFGKVSYSCFTDAVGNKSGVAVKKIDFTAPLKVEKLNQMKSILDTSIPMLRRVRDLPNVLVPDLILRNQKEILVIMERAEMSLFDFMKNQNGLKPEAVAFYMYQLVKAVNQIHDLGLTHGDIKVPNCVLMNRCRLLKVIDTDTLKEEDDVMYTGTKGYAAPEVMETKTVRKPAEVHSVVSCIPVLLSGSETILERNKKDICQFVFEQNRELAAMYGIGAMKPHNERITAAGLVKWFRHNDSDLHQLRRKYTPVTPAPRKTNGDVSEVVIKKYLEEILNTLPRQLNLDAMDEDMTE